MASKEAGLKGRRALITGGASGIGAACARAFAEAGARVVVADVNEGGARELAEEISGEAWPVDLFDTAALAALTLDVDILVNNAGIQHVAPIEDFPPDAFRRILALMLEAPFLLVRAALPHMYAQGFGRVINISSVHGLRASPFKSAYVSATHGLEGLSKVIALEGAAHGVTSNCINPGYVRTPYMRFRYPPGTEDERQSDTVRLSSTGTAFTEGNHYVQLAHELHRSWQKPGTVTAIRCSWVDAPTLTVCIRDEASWRSGQGRDATRDEIKSFTAKALEWF